MRLQVEWSDPVLMRVGPRGTLGYVVDVDQLPVHPGVYVFGRKWGSNGFEALYVGKANNIRSRLTGQLNNLRLMQHVRSAKAGRRIILAGTLITKRGQQVGSMPPYC